MTTSTITLEATDVLASVRILKMEFAKANLLGVKTTAKAGAVHVEMPIAGLSDLIFACAHEQCYWKTGKKKIIVVDMKQFVVEQQVRHNSFHLIFSPSKTGSVPTRKKTSSLRDIFFERSLRAIQELQCLGEKELAEAVRAPNDCSVLLSALCAEEALATICSRDPLARARLRGLEAKKKLIEAEGGALSTAEVASTLEITRQAVDKRRKEGRLLGLELGKKGFLYPAWQIGLPHLEEVLEALGNRDNWEQLGFFLNPSTLLDDRTPLEVLRDRPQRTGDVLRAASVYGEQGA